MQSSRLPALLISNDGMPFAPPRKSSLDGSLVLIDFSLLSRTLLTLPRKRTVDNRIAFCTYDPSSQGNLLRIRQPLRDASSQKIAFSRATHIPAAKVSHPLVPSISPLCETNRSLHPGSAYLECPRPRISSRGKFSPRTAARGTSIPDCLERERDPALLAQSRPYLP